MKGKLIAFEGCEGSGKSTQLRLLSGFLTERGVDFIVTREPGGSEISEEIRKIILNGKNTAMCAECEALLYAAARVQHLKETVIPALEAGKLVICDRYIYSSLAYQGYARGLGEEFVNAVNSFAVENYPPYMTVFLDISPVDAFERKHGADKNDRMEQLGLAFHKKVYAGYKALQAKHPD
ncbi:MAG: dTMP kinase, partial [Clostridia bacterium]|nr:dTMP kinase [Clostridia bacterium]